MAPPPEWLNAAIEHQRGGRFAEAERICNTVLGANPAEADALHLLGLIAASRDQYELAGTMFARAITYKPNRADFYASLGNLFFSRGIVPQMADCYRRALLLSYFSTIPAAYAEIISHAGSDPPASSFTANVDRYKSQYLQDILLDRWIFGGVAGGIFVDIGAHDGVAYSNSYVFEKLRGWRGVCIEPNPTVFAQLAANRQCTTLNCCVSDVAGTVAFLKISGYSEMLSGIVEKYAPEHRERVERELKQFGGSSEVIPVQTRTLDDIAAQCGFLQVTYLSIDTEGSELAILQSIDFKRLFVHAITVEYNFDHVKSRMISLMHGNGFDYVQTLGHDLLFLNRLSPFQGIYGGCAVVVSENARPIGTERNLSYSPVTSALGQEHMTARNGAFSTSDGCSIFYSLHPARNGLGPRLVLIHSLALDRSVWDGVTEQLQGRAEILTYDARGHGQSGRPHMDFTVELFARDLAELMDHVGWSDATIAGCSMGGCVAQALAGIYPGRARGLALIDTTAWYGPEAPKQFRDRATAAQAKGMGGLIDFQVQRWFSDNWREANAERVNRATQVFLNNDFACYAATCALLGDADLRHYLPSFKMPVSVVVGEEDYATPVAMAKALHEAIPQSSLKIITGGRHLTPIQCPDEISDEISRLMERV